MNVEPDVAGPQAEPAVTSRPAPATAPPVLDDEQRALLRATLNRIIPADATLPGAGDLDVGSSIEHTLAASARLRRLFLDGLSAIAITAQHEPGPGAEGGRGPGAGAGAGLNFVEQDAARQTAVLETVEQRWPAFFVALVEHTYRGYYTLPAVQLAVGFEPRPPQPLGHQLPPFDPALLDQQRQRAPFWRRTR